MTPQEFQNLQDTVNKLQATITDLQDKANKLDAFLDVYYRTNFIDKTVFNNKVYFRNDIYLPAKTAFFGSLTPIAKQSAISAPSGGATIDSQSRTAINSLITTLQALGLTS